MKKPTQTDKLLITLLDLLEGGETHITRYRLANESGVDRSQVYRIIKNYNQKLKEKQNV
ncbi:MAG: hypothetical protein M0P91_09740 [Sulfuricurvum sp.]|jgi:hypothetical protein|uniref:hypothetical protein n=1 Tax=Sulfuricurvum sp. TaxID=2025608 RepID=UPI0025F6B9EC|nr:hypothetical protein [Sulfuricurvum sp.]MCK9373470.1 hypothetical protein [Sulfuricurvum sp.]